MNVSVKGNEQITRLLNEWYFEIRARHVTNAQRLKAEIDTMIHSIEEDQNLLLYYSLLDFRHQYLIDSLSISKNSFKKIDSFEEPTDNFLSYFLHFFKAIHFNITGNHTLAKKHYDKAELLLKKIPDEIENAEFYYELAIFYCHIQKPIITINYLQKSKDIFSNNGSGYEMKVAFCNNLYGLAYTQLKEFELAEEHYIAAIESFQKKNEEHFTMIIRHNLGFMYATQNLSSLAIRYLSEVNQKMPSNYKAIFIEAREHSKLGETQIAAELIEKGLSICHGLNNEGYILHFNILKNLNNNVSTKELEQVVIEGLTYFEREELYEYIHEYNEKLAIKFYHEDNHSKASQYFYLSSKAREKLFEKEALK
ncbi:tetratricopeptide repeat protein [Bacillus sp. DX4.1]|uniref:Rap family tetratricopeptide repeat protein n=1 Tax=Bacillus sp. DX4.1 TaxID=3055867 RepID=UPI0025A145A0|nr:Rap family tetratricopeptide repeat protein [Bacillus sp. DX4.1]MDM5188786.1 tetratricopeptide repeat protein [Bacillus sp. DX4.1]